MVVNFQNHHQPLIVDFTLFFVAVCFTLAHHTDQAAFLPSSHADLHLEGWSKLPKFMLVDSQQDQLSINLYSIMTLFHIYWMWSCCGNR